MNLKEKINEDLKNAMKAQDAFRTETLRSIRAEILKMDKSGMNREMNEEEELQLLTRQVKMRKESIEMFQNAGRTDLVERESKQMEIINEYLPKQISREEAEKIIFGIIESTGASTPKDIGKVMGPVMKELKGKFDGKLIQEIVKGRLGG
ncbi:MAG TPA: GatB/YqeY domain-containing protein [Ignavibacteria bacterium]|nr:GatB/YqeY domain-containing protein [Ignavibacteria bacterium]